MRALPLSFFAGIIALLLTGGVRSTAALPGQAASKTTQEQYKALVRRWFDEGFNKRDLTVVDELFAPEVLVNTQRIGRSGLKQSMSRFITAFPDLRVTINEVVAEEDKVVVWYTVQGTQAGEFEGIPATGKQVRWYGADFFRVEKDKIVECRFVDDSLGLLRQLGATLSPPR